MIKAKMIKKTCSFFLMVLLIACNSQPKENVVIENNSTIDTAKASESIRTNISFLNDYNALEQVFSNDNWMIIEKKDTSFFYFSRLGNYSVNTYNYKIVKGDSTSVIQNTILPVNNQLCWMFNGQKVYVSSATRGRVVFSVIGTDSLHYEFLRLDNNRISLTYPNQKKVTLQKTLAFGLFLVRSRYDYTHGTKYAFDSSKNVK